MTNTCPTCHSDNPDTLKFCGGCGTQLPPPQGHPLVVTETLQAPVRELTTGSTFAGRYQVIEELGKGGMGRVYKVFDTKIKEKVALKLIKPEIASDKETIERFGNELRLARNISQRNVCRMFDIGEAEGAHFITMEYVHGEDLKSMIEMSGSLSLGMLLSVGKQVCDGLAEAHSLGVVHRDLKPQNIMIDKHGNAKIMDFGIARSVREKGITGPSVMIGTPEYMSPEQAEAKEVDHRSDIYSLGVILYEMATSHVPFTGETALSIAMKHKGEIPKNPKDLNPQIPDDLSAVILKCLEKDKERRYQSASDVHSELGKIEKGIPTTERVIPEQKISTSREITVKLSPKKLLIPALILAVVVIVAVALYLRVVAQRRAAPAQLAKQSIAAPQSLKKRIVVLPFENQGAPEDDYIVTGITDEITARLSSISQLEVIARASANQYRKTDKSPHLIGEELGVGFILYGTVRWQKLPGGSSKVRVTPSLVRVSDSTQIWAKPYDETIEEVFQVQSDIANSVAETLNVVLLEPEREVLEAKLTNNPEAYDYYLRGREYSYRGTEDKENLTVSIEMFEKSVELDPNFVHAYAGLARSHALMYWYHFDHSAERAEKAKAAADKAIRLNPEAPEARFALGTYYYCCKLDYDHALEQLSAALEKQPKNTEVISYIAFVRRRQGDLEQALKYLKQALELDPRSVGIWTNIGDTYQLLRDYKESEHYFQQAISLAPDYLSAYVSHGSLVWLYLQGLGETKKAREVLERVSRKNPTPEEANWLHYDWVLTNIYDKTYREALNHIGLMPLEARDDQFNYVPKSQLYAQIYGLLGDQQKEREYYDAARIFLEKRIREQPEDSRFRSALGIAYAGLGHRQRAIQEGIKATELLPVSMEYWRGTCRVMDLAQIYVMVGEDEKALDRIEYLLSIPSEISVALLRFDPVWSPLRNNPRFQRLLEN